MKLRNTLVSATSPASWSTDRSADLGTATDPGNNRIVNETSVTGVQVHDTVPGSTVLAIGNTWEPNTQGADANGRYTKPLSVNGLGPLASGKNFDVQQLSPQPSARSSSARRRRSARSRSARAPCAPRPGGRCR